MLYDIVTVTVTFVTVVIVIYNITLFSFTKSRVVKRREELK